MQHGTTTNWDHTELLWQHAFNKLHVYPEEHPIMVTEAPLNPKANREKIVQLAFETFNTPAAFVSLEPVLSLVASGGNTGLVLHIGEGCCTTLASLDGYMIQRCTQRTDLAGRALTEFLGRLLGERGYALGTEAEMEVARDIKEKHCYVARDLDAETEAAASRAALERYRLPDGHTLLLGSERFRCAELLFRPGLMGREELGVHEMVHLAGQSAEVGERMELYSRVLLSGGSTLFPGLEDRLQQELAALVPPSLKVRVIAPPERGRLVWIGGSILASLSHCLWISKEEYEETGPIIVHSKCI
uniref:Actin n=1 Tax=Arcella intermedia TaxID=1963864 RepID=A0A6B2LBE7_9EUKA|eukprot:TRINITY_DN11354_c0_g1_i1.p2 TRINITY_DN11354_c0_g1~~TRINITY_DN11354_c0_g1_i1.p2  ORF type:complete len:302 (+),score=47.29 TRINITY_DN11354_c0_g1_i1:247-1152(+)